MNTNTKPEISPNGISSILFLSFSFTFFNHAEAQKKAIRAETLKEFPIPIVHVKGSHYDVGYQLGTKLKDNLIRKVDWFKKLENWEKVKSEAELFFA